MNPGTEQVLQTALALPEDEKLELIEALIAALDQGETRPFGDEWLAIIQRRSAQLDAGTATPVPWEEVKKRASGEVRRG